jgi:pilus assembly protein Flp/PilA
MKQGLRFAPEPFCFCRVIQARIARNLQENSAKTRAFPAICCWSFVSRLRPAFRTNATHKGSTMQLFKRFLQNQAGATAIEYGLIAAGISIAIIAVVNGLGTQLNTTFSSVSSQLK